MVNIGHACEAKSCNASDVTAEARLAALPKSSDLQALRDSIQDVPRRVNWVHSEAHYDYSKEIESWLHARAGTPFNNETAEYNGQAPRIVTVSKKPPKGTRQRIIGEVARESGLAESVVDNLWQAYRRFMQEQRNSAES